MDARAGIKSPDMTAVGVGGLQVPPSRHRIVISPLNKRRWESFKANRRGYWSLWIFLALFFISLFAEFIANDKPIFIHVNGKSFFPAVMTYPDTDFGNAKAVSYTHLDVYKRQALDPAFASGNRAPFRP